MLRRVNYYLVRVFNHRMGGGEESKEVSGAYH
jgi:hypothetical protein